MTAMHGDNAVGVSELLTHRMHVLPGIPAPTMMRLAALSPKT
ncbi:MAG: hypothetical protein ACRDTX_31060 [Pseudonocardiaceae bacterium]